MAEITDLSISMLRRQIRLERLAVYRVRGALRIADLAAWLARHRRAAC